MSAAHAIRDKSGLGQRGMSEPSRGSHPFDAASRRDGPDPVGQDPAQSTGCRSRNSGHEGPGRAGRRPSAKRGHAAKPKTIARTSDAVRPETTGLRRHNPPDRTDRSHRAGLHRLAAQEAAQVGREVSRARVAMPRSLGHRLQADRLEVARDRVVEPPGRPGFFLADPDQQHPPRPGTGACRSAARRG